MTSSTDQLAKAPTRSAPGLERFKMYIDGAWCEAASGKTFETKNPFTGEVWAHIPRAGAADVGRAVKAAHAAFTSGPLARVVRPTAVSSSAS